MLIGGRGRKKGEYDKREGEGQQKCLRLDPASVKSKNSPRGLVYTRSRDEPRKSRGTSGLVAGYHCCFRTQYVGMAINYLIGRAASAVHCLCLAGLRS